MSPDKEKCRFFESHFCYRNRYQKELEESLAPQGFPPAFCYFGAETLPNKGKPATRIFPINAETLAPQRFQPPGFLRLRG